MLNRLANPEIDENLWRAWVEKGRQMEKVTARNAKVFGGIVLIALALVFEFTFFAASPSFALRRIGGR